jgi:hypothetical protein
VLVAQLGGLALLIEAMKRFPADPDVQKNACGTLWNLALNGLASQNLQFTSTETSFLLGLLCFFLSFFQRTIECSLQDTEDSILFFRHSKHSSHQLEFKNKSVACCGTSRAMVHFLFFFFTFFHFFGCRIESKCNCAKGGN